MIDVSLILLILIDYQKESLGIPTTIPAESHQIKSCKDKKEERSFHNGCITCSRNSKHDNRRRQLRTVLSEFQKKIPQSNSRILESYSKQQYNPRDPRDSPPINQSHWDPTAVT